MISLEKAARLWHSIEVRFIPGNFREGDLLRLWREKIIFFIFFFAAAAGPFALVPSLFLAFKEQLFTVFFLDLIAYLIVLFVLFYPKITLEQKTLITFILFYALGSGLIFLLGFYGAGYIWLFGASLIVGTMMGFKAAGLALAANLLTLVANGVYIELYSPAWAGSIDNPLQKWWVMSINFILINSLITLLVAAMLNSLKLALSGEQAAASELKNNREELKAIFNASPDPVIVYDSSDTIQYSNKAFTSVFGWTEDELKTGAFSILTNDRLTFGEYFSRKSLSHGVIRFDGEHETKYGTVLNLGVSAAPIMDKKDKLLGVVVNLKDLTDIRIMEARLQQAEKMEAIGILAGGIAHDFNNILFPIIGYAEMIKSDIKEESPFSEGISYIYEGAVRAKDLVKQILTFSRREKTEASLIKIQPVIAEVLKMLRSIIPATIHIDKDISQQCGMIMADPTQIHQVIMNLAINAFHAMEDKGGVLNVSLKEIMVNDSKVPLISEGVYACLCISDTGVGMEEDITKKIFDPFFTTKKKGKGSGMGLSVVHGIVKGLGGDIEVLSEPGRGSRFNVYIPVVRDSADSEVPRDFKKLPEHGNEHIMLVDDEPAILAMEKRMLEKLGYRATCCGNGRKALSVFMNAPDSFDLVITDMEMPDMTGKKLAVELKKLRPHIPVLLCTGYSDDLSYENKGEGGISGVIIKPVMMKDLAAKIRGVLGR